MPVSYKTMTSKAKQKRSLDKGAGHSLYAQELWRKKNICFDV